MSAAADCAALHKAMKGLGTDDKKLVEILCNRSHNDIRAIAHEYSTHHSKTLESAIKSETSGNYRKLLIGLVQPRPIFYAKSLRKAIAGLGTEDGCLVDILAYGSNADIRKTAEEYKIIHNKDLRDDIKGDTSGHYEKLLLALAEGNRDESAFNPADHHKRIEEDAHTLHKKGEGRLGTDDDHFVQFFSKHSHDYIAAVNKKYEEMYGHGLAKAVKKETSGDFLRLLKAICYGRNKYFAKRAHHAIAGLGTNDRLLRRVFIINNKDQLRKIATEYEKLFKNTLEKDIKGDTSGWYEKTYLALLH